MVRCLKSMTTLPCWMFAVKKERSMSDQQNTSISLLTTVYQRGGDHQEKASSKGLMKAVHQIMPTIHVLQKAMNRLPGSSTKRDFAFIWASVCFLRSRTTSSKQRSSRLSLAEVLRREVILMAFCVTVCRVFMESMCTQVCLKEREAESLEEGSEERRASSLSECECEREASCEETSLSTFWAGVRRAATEMLGEGTGEDSVQALAFVPLESQDVWRSSR
mmetsp:Transcript_55373/g.171808  ORF Transcript_55373/g.171808 Transcript_55373/m.171808 type:complete len:220 (+) Transcript_55373:740-1399(+)